MGALFYVPLDKATTPRDGECIVNNWWSVHPEKGIAFWAQIKGYARSEEPSPQCNRDEQTARLLTKRLYADHEVQQIPVVYVGHALREMNRLRAADKTPLPPTP